MALRPFSQFYGGVGPHLLVPQQNSWVKSGRYACGSAVPAPGMCAFCREEPGTEKRNHTSLGRICFLFSVPTFQTLRNHLMVPDVVSWAFRHFLPFAAQKLAHEILPRRLFFGPPVHSSSKALSEIDNSRNGIPLTARGTTGRSDSAAVLSESDLSVVPSFRVVPRSQLAATLPRTR